jgi:threonine dehydrogenase-like Zn-dependent dehydrogenase
MAVKAAANGDPATRTGNPRMARALWYTAAGTAEIRQEDLPAPGDGEVLVETRFSALSRGTESLVLAGAVPPSEQARMRAPFQAGAFPFPVKYGYAAVGTVLAGPADLIGQTVFALYPHQTAFVVPVAAAIAVPATVPLPRAVLAANMETALNALWDAPVRPGSRVAVIGAGTVGALISWLAARVAGTEVTLVDLRASRATLASNLGCAFALPAQAPADCDLVFHASASAAGLNTAIAAAGDEATVVEMSWYGEREVAARLGGAFHSRRLQLVASQVGQVAPAMRPRWTHRRRLARALELLADSRLEALLEPAIAFDRLPAALPQILGPGGDVLCQVISYPGGV